MHMERFFKKWVNLFGARCNEYCPLSYSLLPRDDLSSRGEYVGSCNLAKETSSLLASVLSSQVEGIACVRYNTRLPFWGFFCLFF